MSVSDFTTMSALLGGGDLLGHRLATRMDLHEITVTGLPNVSALHLFRNLALQESAISCAPALGMSLRTIQRREADPGSRLDSNQTAKTLKFAEILAAAIGVFGSQKDAERWLLAPAIGLDRQIPMHLMRTPAGADLVLEHLGRLEYGVYS